MKSVFIFSVLAFTMVSNAWSVEIHRRCWHTKTEFLDVSINGDQILLVNPSNETRGCQVHRDPHYPNSHVPKEYQNWARFFDGQPRDQSTDFGRKNPCTLMLGRFMGSYDTSEVFAQLKIDSTLADPRFKGGARMEIATNGDGAGPYRTSYICR